MFNFLTEISFLQAIACICVTYLIGKFLVEYFAYLKACHPASLSIVKADMKTLENRIDRIARKLTFVMSLVTKKEDNNVEN
jgi:hypothetical protein